MENDTWNLGGPGTERDHAKVFLVRRMAGLPLRSPTLLSMAMWAMPRWEMARALRCQRLLFFF